jgi:hypothetical protein
VLFSCPKSLHTNYTPVALILLRLYALPKHPKTALCQQKKQQLTPLLTSVCSSTKESEVTFGNAVSASMEVTYVTSTTGTAQTISNYINTPTNGLGYAVLSNAKAIVMVGNGDWALGIAKANSSTLWDGWYAYIKTAQ